MVNNEITSTNLFGPVSFSFWWWVLAIGATVLFGLLIWVLVRLLKPKAARPVLAEQSPEFDWQQMFQDSQQHALQSLSAVQDNYRTRQISASEANLQVSTIIREYGSVRTGLDLRTLTLAELETLEAARPILPVVAHMYLPTFAGDLDLTTEQISAQQGELLTEVFETAARTVQTW